MTDKEFVKEKINLITRDLERLREFSGFTISRMAEDFMRYAALKNILTETIGRAIDVNEHLIGELAKPTMSSPKTYKETFLFLGDLDVLPKDFAKEISKSAGFRNAIIHEYNNLEKGIVYRSVGDAIEQYIKYCGYILKFLEQG